MARPVRDDSHAVFVAASKVRNEDKAATDEINFGCEFLSNKQAKDQTKGTAITKNTIRSSELIGKSLLAQKYFRGLMCDSI